ncbi:MAG: HAD-IA family hydrolase [Gammaproteobacteria bacterium]|nr:HAD-IA family hydrolase [Gammaproteobacteria bacterium]
MQQIELVIFDWDGTLIDSQANIVQCLQWMINDLNLPHRTENQLSNIIGLGLYEALNDLFPDHDVRAYEQMVDRYRYHFLSSDPSQPFPGAESVLSHLAGNDYLLAVATGKGRRGLDKALDSTGFRQWFHATRCADETRSKPHPQMLEEILEELGVEPQKAVMIGDTEYDLQMAKNAGVHAIGVSYGVHDTERLQQCEPVAVIDEIRALLNWLGGEKIAI